jgi:hypothetical protein
LSVSRPIEVVVLKDWVTLTNVSTRPTAEPTLFDRLEDYPDEAAS